MASITLPDGSIKQLADGSTVAELAESIGKRLAAAAVVGRVDGKLVDLSHKLTGEHAVQILTDRDPDADHDRGDQRDHRPAPRRAERLVLGVDRRGLPGAGVGRVRRRQRRWRRGRRQLRCTERRRLRRPRRSARHRLMAFAATAAAGVMRALG